MQSQVFEANAKLEDVKCFFDCLSDRYDEVSRFCSRSLLLVLSCVVFNSVNSIRGIFISSEMVHGIKLRPILYIHDILKVRVNRG